MLASFPWKSGPLLLLLQLAMAQSPADLFTKAPPEVDAALRSRIAKFYQAHVDGKPRHAEEVVAEDSKDYFYNIRKPQFLSFQISKIEYSKDFTEAKVITLVETYVVVLGFGNKPMKVPVTSLWKIENGQWCWYVTEDLINTTPFGRMGNPPGGGGSNAPMPDTKNAPSVAAISQQVKADKLMAVLKAGESSSDQVTIHNGMPGTVTLELRGPTRPGLEIKVDRAEIPAGENAVVSFHFEPGQNVPTRPTHVDVAIQPLNTIIPLRVTFK
jgi:hypothetical protein